MSIRLKELQQYISTDTLDFNQFYQNYIQSVQEYSLEIEVTDLQKSDVLSIDKLITKLYAEMLRT